MLELLELRPFDIIVSYKPPDKKLGKIPDKGILHYGKKLYPNGSVKWNHIRVVQGYDPSLGVVAGFEWTWPVSREIEIEEWMLAEGYSRVVRIHGLPIMTFGDIHTAIQPHLGKGYDWLQLLGIFLHQKWIQLGDDHEVCSTGVTSLYQEMTGKNLFNHLADWEVPPCSFVNHPEIFWILNPVLRALSIEEFLNIPKLEAREAKPLER